MIDHQDDEVRRAHRRNEDLERWRSEAAWDYCRAHNDIDHLRRTLEGKRNSPSEVHSTRSLDKHLVQRPRNSDREHHGERTSWRAKGLFSRERC